jgi:hypothetical protein
MPGKKEEKPKRIKFSMETRSFATIWRNHTSHPGKDNWRAFVLACYERYTRDGNTGNRAALKDSDESWDKWTDDQQYGFLSERCYAKCITIRRKLKTEKGLSVELPEGYKDRDGKKVSKRVSIDELADIFSFSEGTE